MIEALTFDIDIDGTIAKRNVPRFMRKCNTYFKMGLSQKVLDSLDWPSWLALPEIKGYRERIGQAAWKRNLAAVALDPAYQRSLLPVDGAVEGIWRLAEIGRIRYRTGRKTTISDEWNQLMADATHAWLREQGFPNPDEVTFCTSPAEKLRDIAKDLQGNKKQIILIDDLYEQLLRNLTLLSTEHQQILMQHQRFTLCAFGGGDGQTQESYTNSTYTAETIMRIIRLSRWSSEYLEPFLVDVGSVVRAL